MKYLILLIISIAFVGCDNSKPVPGLQDINTGTKSCIEQQGVDLLRVCFRGNTTAYSKWKTCVANGFDPVKCYTKKAVARPPFEPVEPPVPDIACGERPYFCFRYYIATLTTAEVDTWEGYIVTSDPALRQTDYCEFMAHPNSQRKLVLKDRLQDFLFDVIGQSSCGSQSVEDWAFFRVDVVDITNHRYSTGISDSANPLVRIDTLNYRPGSSLFFRLRSNSFAHPNPASNQLDYKVSGEFAFIARLGDSNQYMIVFDGKFDMDAIED